MNTGDRNERLRYRAARRMGVLGILAGLCGLLAICSPLEAGEAAAAGGFFSLGPDCEGTAWVWGSNDSGQLGINSWGPSSTNRAVQIHGVNNVGFLSNVVATAAGTYHWVALLENSTLRSCGANWAGQLGDGTTSYRITPVAVSSLSNVVAISAGHDHTLALREDGTVWAFGANDSGQIGDGTTTQRTSPVQVSGLSNVVAVAAGSYHSIALKGDGTLFGWGYNQYGQVGDGTKTTRLSPVQCVFTNGVAVACGTFFTVMIKADSTVWGVGANWYSQLGNGSSANEVTNPVQAVGLTGATAIDAGDQHSIARKSDGSMWAWGLNSSGQLGDGTTSNRSTPVQSTNLTGVVEVSAGKFHSLAVKSDGTIWSTGLGSSGQLGNATNSNASSVVQATNVIICVPAPPPPELVGHWKFDEGTSTNAFDSTTNLFHGVLLGSPLPTWTTSGVFSNALTFDGDQNEVRVADAPKLSPDTEITVSAWVKPASTNEGFTVSKWATNGLSGSYLLWVTATNAEFNLFLEGDQVTLLGTNTLSLGNWHLVTATYDGAAMKLYLNGALHNTLTTNGLIDAVSEPLLIGGVEGTMDDVRLYNYALASTNVLALYQAGDNDLDGIIDALDPDDDNDGLPDWWELQYGLNPLDATGNNGASGDPDGDGVNNLTEYLQGRNPTKGAIADPGGAVSLVVYTPLE